MKVVVGNPFAIEGYRDENSDNPDQVMFRSVDGERETTFQFPEDTNVTSAVFSVIESLPMHMDLSSGGPAWIECDEPMVKKILCQHFNISDRKRRPAKWGDGTNGPYNNTSKDGE